MCRVDFKKYQDIYVFCDSDPIGYYLNYKKIHYHAVEDGLIVSAITIPRAMTTEGISD